MLAKIDRVAAHVNVNDFQSCIFLWLSIGLEEEIHLEERQLSKIVLASLTVKGLLVKKKLAR